MTDGEAELAAREMRLSQQALGVARLALERDALEDAASRLYYAVFHAARAALIVRALRSKTHAGLIELFVSTFGAAPVLGRSPDW